jgi:hypothetical protein
MGSMHCMGCMLQPTVWAMQYGLCGPLCMYGLCMGCAHTLYGLCGPLCMAHTGLAAWPIQCGPYSGLHGLHTGHAAHAPIARSAAAARDEDSSTSISSSACDTVHIYRPYAGRRTARRCSRRSAAGGARRAYWLGERGREREGEEERGERGRGGGGGAKVRGKDPLNNVTTA